MTNARVHHHLSSRRQVHVSTLDYGLKFYHVFIYPRLAMLMIWFYNWLTKRKRIDRSFTMGPSVMHKREKRLSLFRN